MKIIDFSAWVKISKKIHQFFCSVKQKKKKEDNKKDFKFIKWQSQEFLDYRRVTGIFLIYCYLNCEKHYKIEFDENLKEKFKNTFNFCHENLNKLVLLLL